MPSNHLILCRPLLLLPSIFPSNRIISNESVLHIRWPKYWSFRFSVSPSNEYSRVISFRMDWLDLLAPRDSQESSPTPHFKSINSLALSFIYSPTLHTAVCRWSIILVLWVEVTRAISYKDMWSWREQITAGLLEKWCLRWDWKGQLEMADPEALTDKEGNVKHFPGREGRGGSRKGRGTGWLGSWSQGGVCKSGSPRLPGPEGSFPRDRRSCWRVLSRREIKKTNKQTLPRLHRKLD